MSWIYSALAQKWIWQYGPGESMVPNRPPPDDTGYITDEGRTQTPEPEDVEMKDAPSAEFGENDSGYGSSPHSTAAASDYSCPDDLWAKYVGHDIFQLVFENPRWWPKLEEAGYRNVPLPGPPEGDLVNDLSPLLELENFIQEDPSSKIMANLTPTLRLASRILDSEPYLAFLRHIMFGIERWDDESQRIYLAHSELENRPEATEAVQEELRKLSKKLKWIFAAINLEGCGQVHAVHYVSLADFGKEIFVRGMIPGSTDDRHYITVNQAYKDFFSQDLSKVAPDAIVRTAWILATVIVHETAHAFYARRRTDGNEDYREPFFSLSQAGAKGELGDALDQTLYNGRVHSIIHPVRGCEAEWMPLIRGMVGSTVIEVDSPLRFPIAVRWQYQFFTNQWWNRFFNLPTSYQMMAFELPEPGGGAVIEGGVESWVCARTGRAVKGTLEAHARKDREVLKKWLNALKKEKKREAKFA